MPTVAIVTMTPAVKTPMATAARERLNGTLKRKAAKDPVHAPVMGSGIATNRMRAINVPWRDALDSNRFRVRANERLRSWNRT